jgi:hypothetical protein
MIRTTWETPSPSTLPGTPSSDNQDATFIRGDCNGDRVVAGSLGDVVFLLEAAFNGGEKPSCAPACDADGDGLNAPVTDAIYLIWHSFLAGPPPPPPYPDCGAGATGGFACEGNGC